MEGDFRDLDSVPAWWRLGFDGKALLEAVVGTVVGLIALFSSYDHINLPTASSRSSSNGASGSSLSPFRSFLRMLNWRRDPEREMRLKQLESETEQLKKERKKADRERNRVARLDALRARLDRGRLAFQLDPSAGNRRKLQRLLSLFNSPEMAELYRD